MQSQKETLVDVGGDTDVTIVHYTRDLGRVCLCEWLCMSFCACFWLCVCVCVVVCAFLVVCMCVVLFADNNYCTMFDVCVLYGQCVFHLGIECFHHLLCTDGWSKICNVCGCRIVCCVCVPCVLCGGCVCLFVLDIGAQMTIVGPH